LTHKLHFNNILLSTGNTNTVWKTSHYHLLQQNSWWDATVTTLWCGGIDEDWSRGKWAVLLVSMSNLLPLNQLVISTVSPRILCIYPFTSLHTIAVGLR